ncbi:hypothetical protein D9619_002553 [Psilocybe cf. subviscida]|uniref:Uncharacterized protein n=1 Tax=Psilocybe cf. subviscida TaxID=2480587 RepID=A0A8H5ETU3_9AGAR|nr:hypothetical protein D9619_002553 [Psilocybe cf. subviscida]
MTMPTSLDQESMAESLASRHSSLQGPYRHAMKETQTASFPFCNHIKSPEGDGKSYARSLLLAGHGFPFLNPKGPVGNRPSAHVESGLCVGDVIAVNSSSSFKYFFNIFKPASDPAQSQMTPPSFEPFGTPLEDMDVKTKTLPPGTTITSAGVNVSRVSSSPLEINLVTSAREAAFMVLPEGASCEDLANPSILHLYLKKHAAEWYRHLRIEEQYEISNGSLYLVTGCDRPASQCCTWASIPARYPGRSLPSPNIDIRYRYENNNVSVTGQNNGNIMLYDYPRNSRVAVFIRGLRIALGAVSWPQTNNAFDSSREYYRSLSTPTVGRYAKVLQLRDRHFRVPENPEIEGILSEFHPSNIIFPILLRMRPTARLAVVDDATWMSVAHGESGTVPEITDLILRVFSQHKIVTKDGIVFLEPKTAEDAQETTESSGLSCLPLRKRDEEANQIRDLVKELLRNRT